MAREPEQSSNSGLSRAAAFAIVLFAVAGLVRAYELGARGFWVDEFFSLAGSAGRYPNLKPLKLNEVMRGLPSFTDVDQGRPWWAIWAQMREGTHPPLYIILLRFWRELFGNGDRVSQVFSVACSMAALGLLWDAARRLFGHGVALWAGTLMAVAWPQVHFAQEVRPYALLLALGMGAMHAIVLIEMADPVAGRWRARQAYLGVMLLAMALTHYFAVGALGAVGLYMLVRFRGRQLRDTLITCGVSAVVFMLAWGPSMWAQRHSTTYEFLENPHARPALVTLERADQLPVRYLVDADWRPWLPGVGAVLLAGGALLAWKKDRQLLLPLLWLTVTAGFIVALDVVRSTQHVYLTRYTVLASPGLYLLLPAALHALRPAAAHVVCGALVALCAAALPHYYLHERENWRGWADALKESAQPGDAVVLGLDAQGRDPWYATVLFIAMSHYAHDSARPVLVVDRPATPAAIEQLAAQRIWMVYGTPGGAEVAGGKVRGMVPGYRVVRSQKFSTAELFELERDG